MSGDLAEAERLEREAWARLHDFQDAVTPARDALALREALQGPEHPDLVWPLSLWIEALLRKHTLESARAAERLGARRLRLQERALAASPAAYDLAVDEQIRLCTFEDEVFDPAAAQDAELRRRPRHGR